MRMIHLTNADSGDEGMPLALNVEHIASVYQVFDSERRIDMMSGRQFIVAETFDEILAAVNG